MKSHCWSNMCPLLHTYNKPTTISGLDTKVVVEEDRQASDLLFGELIHCIGVGEKVGTVTGNHRRRVARWYMYSAVVVKPWTPIWDFPWKELVESGTLSSSVAKLYASNV